MRPNQEVEVESGSTVFQAGRDNNVTNVGMITTYDELRKLILEVFQANFLKFLGTAQDVAQDRAERIIRDFLDTLRARNPAALQSIADPDMLNMLYAGVSGYARSGEDDLARALIDMLVDRAGQQERGLELQLLNRAIETVPKLTRGQRATLAITFFVKHIQYDGAPCLPDLYNFMNNCISPFVNEMAISRADFGYMRYAGAGNMSSSNEGLFRAMARGLSGRNNCSDPSADFSKIVQILAPLTDHQAFPQDSSMETLLANVPSMSSLVRQWDQDPPGLASFSLTPVGIAIGHSCQRSVGTTELPLRVFLDAYARP